MTSVRQPDSDDPAGVDPHPIEETDEPARVADGEPPIDDPTPVESDRGLPRRRLRWGLAVLAALILAAAGTLAVLDLRPVGSPAADTQQGDGAAAVAALEGASGRPTLLGRVREVRDPVTVVVDVEGRPVTVSVIGLDISALPDCARPGATAFARGTLDGESVTLVPDPTLPLDPAAPTWPAYLVLGSQQSYTDAALRAGWADPGPGRYRSGFEFGRQQARDTDAGMWGPPCNRR